MSTIKSTNVEWTYSLCTVDTQVTGDGNIRHFHNSRDWSVRRAVDRLWSSLSSSSRVHSFTSSFTLLMIQLTFPEFLEYQTQTRMRTRTSGIRSFSYSLVNFWFEQIPLPLQNKRSGSDQLVLFSGDFYFYFFLKNKNATVESEDVEEGFE